METTPVFSLEYIFLGEKGIFTGIKAHPHIVLMGHVPSAWDMRVCSFPDVLPTFADLGIFLNALTHVDKNALFRETL